MCLISSVQSVQDDNAMIRMSPGRAYKLRNVLSYVRIKCIVNMCHLCIFCPCLGASTFIKASASDEMKLLHSVTEFSREKKKKLECIL